jgi:hypothetical protein
VYSVRGGGCSNVNGDGCGGTHEPLVPTHQEEIFFQKLILFPSATCFLNITLTPHYCSMLSLYRLGWLCTMSVVVAVPTSMLVVVQQQQQQHQHQHHQQQQQQQQHIVH